VLRPFGAMWGWRGGSAAASRSGVAGDPWYLATPSSVGSFGIGAAAAAGAATRTRSATATGNTASRYRRRSYAVAVPELHVLRVFCRDGGGGNSLGVFLDGAEIAGDERQAVAADLGFAETVFVDDADSGEVAIYTPATELDFAGHPTVGTAWLIARERRRVEVLRPPAGDVPARTEAERAFVSARLEWGPAFEHVRLGAADEVDALEEPPGGGELVAAWAWIDEDAGVVRCRVFASGIGVFEDEATGSAATRLCAKLGREIEIRQGRGSRILARPTGDGRAEIGGRVELDEVRDYSKSGANRSS
jgi:predicted PhzF superfamily epimerase YddE/YHI9